MSVILLNIYFFFSSRQLISAARLGLFGAEDSKALSSLAEEVISSPQKYMDDFRQQMRDMPMLAEMAGTLLACLIVMRPMIIIYAYAPSLSLFCFKSTFLDVGAGISMAVVNDDKKWKRFEKSLKSNLALLGGTGEAGLPDVSDIFGVQDPQFANIMEKAGALQKDIEKFQSSSKKKKTSKEKKKQSYQSSSSAM